MRVVPDPNVLLSAIIAAGGASDQALRAAMTNARLVVPTTTWSRWPARTYGLRFGLYQRLAEVAVAGIPPEMPRYASAVRRLPSSYGIMRYQFREVAP